MAAKLTHLDQQGRLRMVDVGAKDESQRLARVRGEIHMQPKTLRLIADNKVTKGNVLEVARLAGIMAAKRTGELIPLCHPLNLTAVELDFQLGEDCVSVEAEARIKARTGVEMEAFTAATVALLTIYDMCKAVDRGMVITQVQLIEKRGGKSGTYLRQQETEETPQK
jgi:cyclic pyranopterin phosphate synthase